MSALDVQGKQLLSALEAHVLAAMRVASEAQPGAAGMTNREIETVTGLEADVPEQRGWISWTVLHVLVARGAVEKTGRKYRLTASGRHRQ